MLKTIRPEAISDNPFKLIGSDWMLITACEKSVDEDRADEIVGSLEFDY